MDIFKKTLAPITDEAWKEINEQATSVFKNVLSARKFVDVEGPHGLDFGAVARGRLHVPEGQEKNPVKFGIHQVHPLIECRIPFTLDIWELDNSVRGAEDIELEPLEKAAREIALFEEKAIYYGLSEANIKGLREKTEHEIQEFPDDPEKITEAVSEGIVRFKNSYIEGPYALIMNTGKWEKVASYIKGYPLLKQIEQQLLGGPVIISPFIHDTFLVSKRGGDFRLVLGQDLSIGFNSVQNNDVNLYFMESFTFMIMDPNAIMMFKK